MQKTLRKFNALALALTIIGCSANASPTTEDPGTVFRRDYERDETAFRTAAFTGKYFLSVEEVGDLASKEGLYGKFVIDEPKTRATVQTRSICNSITLEDLVSMANPIKASNTQYSTDLFTDDAYKKLYESDKSMYFRAELAVFDIPREQSLDSLVRRASDELALNGGECKIVPQSWKWDSCEPIYEALETSKIPGWFQHSDLSENGCELEPSTTEYSVTLDRVTDLYFPNQFFILFTPTVNSDYRNVSVYWFLPAEWLGVMFYIETSLILINGAPFSSESPSVAEVVNSAGPLFKTFKELFVQRLSANGDLPKFEDLFVRRTVLATSE